LGGFPLGGYVKMLDEREGPVAPAEAHRAFNRQSVYKRFVIVSAGPVANFLLAILLYWGLFLTGVPGVKPVIGPPTPDSPAAAAGFERGETLARVDGAPMQTWQDARWALLKAGVARSTVKIETVGPSGTVAHRTLDLSGLGPEDLDGEFIETIGLTRFQPQLAPKVGQVLSGRPAERAGLKVGDVIVAIDGIAIRHWADVVRDQRVSGRNARDRGAAREWRRGHPDRRARSGHRERAAGGPHRVRSTGRSARHGAPAHRDPLRLLRRLRACRRAHLGDVDLQPADAGEDDPG
jgi:regulator of sigma E protease